MTTTENITADAPDIFAAPIPENQAVEAHILMQRDPDKGGLGMTKAVVPASEVANWQAAGWAVCDE